jgi:adenylate cyclase
LKFYKFKDSNSYYTHTYYSASDILKSAENIKNGKPPIVDPSVFDNKYVLIGANAKAAALGLEDALQTPVSIKQPGVDIQATNLDNLINNDYMKIAPLTQNLIAILFMFLIAFIIICNFSVLKSLVILGAVAFAYFVYVFINYSHGISVDIVTPILIEFITTVFGYSYRFIVEGRNKEKIKQAMGKYISQNVMENVVQNIDEVKLGGKRAVVTVLFSDIRGFTSMSEKMSAEDVSKILNEYFSEMEPIITKYNGVINKFIGDAVMAIFGEPVQDLNHPVNAVKCAYEMLKKVEELQDKWLFEGKPKIEIGIGINTGEAFVGNIGSEKRLEYTVIGDTVNLASRIEGYNKVYHTNFLVSSSTYKYISDIADVIKISDVTIRGKSKKMDIYEILQLKIK